MAVEFNLLYRWHGLIPSHAARRRRRPLADDLQPARWWSSAASRRLIEDASRQRAGRDRPVQHRPRAARGRAGRASARRAPSQLAPYNDYRELAQFPRVTDFDQITGDARVQAALRELYGHVDRIEFFPGLFAEDARPNSVLPSLIGRMVGVDAFSQALTNPLLAPRVFNAADVLAARAWRSSRATRRLSDILHRNIPESPGSYLVTMTREGWGASDGSTHSLADVYEFLTPEALLTPEGNVAAFAPWSRPAARGCSTARAASGCWRRAWRARLRRRSATDASPEMVERTRALAGRRRPRACARGRTCRRPGTSTPSSASATRSRTPRDRLAALRGMAGALRPGGRCSCSPRATGSASSGRRSSSRRRSERGGRRALVTRAWTSGNEIASRSPSRSSTRRTSNRRRAPHVLAVHPRERSTTTSAPPASNRDQSTFTPNVRPLLVTARSVLRDRG